MTTIAPATYHECMAPRLPWYRNTSLLAVVITLCAALSIPLQAFGRAFENSDKKNDKQAKDKQAGKVSAAMPQEIPPLPLYNPARPMYWLPPPGHSARRSGRSHTTARSPARAMWLV